VKVELRRHDPEWSRRFDQEARRISGKLGQRVGLLEHVGSTAVPGLVAKPIIDIVLAVADSADEASYVPQLEELGYELRAREPDWYEHRVFRGGEDDVNLHVFTVGTSEIERMLAFRDLLRSRLDYRVRYEKEKLLLAGREWDSIQQYADAKSDVVEAILNGGRRG
jgi:GrpB-like predicted nucleotidyltransferase (UPF0157 family)